MAKVRLDKLLLDRGMETSRERAQARILAGDVRVNDRVASKAGDLIDEKARVELVGEVLRFVSRGGLKLEQALIELNVSVENAVALDVGASTGGFTDCLLQRGAQRVFAVDVGYGQLAWKIRTDPRVVVLERQNARYLTREHVPEPIDVVVVDCSFVGIGKVAQGFAPLMKPGGNLVALIKPQFEAGPDGVGKGGVVRDVEIRAKAIASALSSLADLGFEIVAGVDSSTPGPKGNVEYLVHGIWRERPRAEDATADAKISNDA